MIKLNNINAGYNKVTIIKNININFEKGSIISIIGKNGCGKSTLLRTASNLLKPFSGEITINGTNISAIDRRELSKIVSFLPQHRPVPNMSVYNLVMHGRYPYLGFSRTKTQQDKDIVENAIRSMGLDPYRNKNIQELSGGERQKAYIAMILAQDTDIIFLDEPTTYLDINHHLEILEITKELKGLGKTVVMVLHDLHSALAYSEKICLMDKGEIVMYDTPERVFASKEIDRIFSINSEMVKVGMDEKPHYAFYC
ncbi:MAG: ABC transporter ATP-binding protein [Clostridiaceae bacterium]|jgi:iron complex transport system ATP-binding protein|nr:ABC transporter ATP-binding protein [Clostridiaceae bacterium]